MIIYSVTVRVDEPIAQDWKKWMAEQHIPDVMATGKFLEYRMCQVMVETEEGGISYNIQYVCQDEETLNDYAKNHAPALQKDHNERYAGKFNAFRTMLEVIDHNSKAL